MSSSSDYKNRIADKLLKEQLEASGAVLIQGPKWCGKTSTAERIAGSCTYMDDPTKRTQYQIFAETNPMMLLQGDAPHLVDEWQLAPNLWDAARFDISHRGLIGQYIFTGSAVPPDISALQHSGIGRFARLTMRPMSLWESGESDGKISLRDIFKGEASPVATQGKTLDELCFLICRGGWPGVLKLSEKSALLQARNYVDAVAQNDISRVDGTSRNAELAYKLLRSYARHQGQAVPLTIITLDINASPGSASTSEDTISSYISALNKIFVIEDMPAWNPNLRSKTAIRTSDNRYFIDPSIATAALGAGPNDLMNDLNTLGLLFETLCVRDLRVYADTLDGKIHHYRDKNGLECDAVLHLRDGRYGLIEIKLGGDRLVSEGISNILKLASKIDTDKMNEPSFLMVLTGVGSYAYQTPEGVWVVPISCLKD